MASPIGHLLGAIAVYTAFSKRDDKTVPSGKLGYILPALIGILPDLDVVAYVLFGFAYGPIHRGVSHSLLMGIIFALFISLFFIKNGFRYFLKTWIILSICSLIHPLLDYLMGCGSKVPFFWPFDSQGYISPVQLIPTAYYSTSFSGLLEVVVMPETWKGIFLETISILPLIVANTRTDKIRYLMICISLIGFIVTYVLYN